MSETLEQFRQDIGTRAHIQVLKAKTNEEMDALLGVLANNLGFVMALMAAQHEDPAKAADLMCEAMSVILLDATAGWLPMASIASGKGGGNEEFLAAFERKMKRDKSR
jgi:hypothetical protein